MDERKISIALSVNEACKSLGIGRTLLYAEIGAGRLKIIKVGRRTLILANEIEAWLRLLGARDPAPELSPRTQAHSFTAQLKR